IAATLIAGRIEKTLPATAQPALRHLEDMLQQSIREVRTVSYLLHPPLLDEAGLGLALRHYIEGFQERSSIAVELDISPTVERLPPGRGTGFVLVRLGSSDQHFPTFEEFYGANPSHARAHNERGRCRAHNRGRRQRHAGRPRRASIDRPKERPHAGCRVGEHARALAADRRTARNRFRG